jgi:hypothetical protein
MELLQSLLEAIAQREDIVIRSFVKWKSILERRYAGKARIVGDVFTAKAYLGTDVIGKWKNDRGEIYQLSRSDTPDRDDGTTDDLPTVGKEWAWEGVVPAAALPVNHLRNYLK